MAWISVRNWRKFQHYDPAKRPPLWIKVYGDLLHNDDFLNLTAHRRGVLVTIWLEYALSKTCLRLDVKLLNSRLGLNTKMSDYEALENAGFIDILASKPLADGYQVARAEVEVEKEQPLPNPVLDQPANGGVADMDFGAVLKDISTW